MEIPIQKVVEQLKKTIAELHYQVAILTVANEELTARLAEKEGQKVE